MLIIVYCRELNYDWQMSFDSKAVVKCICKSIKNARKIVSYLNLHLIDEY